MVSIRAGVSLWALAGLVGALACGRTPVWVPCGTPVSEDGVPAPTCESSCGGSNRVRIELPPTNALVVLDRSCSMAVVTAGVTKWARAVEAVGAMVLDPRAEAVRWGLTLFPDRDLDGVQGPVLVPVAPDQSQALAAFLISALDRDDPNHPDQPGEPCFTNLGDAAEQLGRNDPFAGLDGRGHIILITDGIVSRAGEIAARLDTFFVDRDVPTFVVGFGEDVNGGVLQQLGEAGGVPASEDTAYYRAGLDDLGGALTQVVQSLRCRQALRLEPQDVGKLEVRTDDGELIPQDPGGVEGWRYDPGTEAISFAGQACNELLEGRIGSIDLVLDCG